MLAWRWPVLVWTHVLRLAWGSTYVAFGFLATIVVGWLWFLTPAGRPRETY